jgi:hypothetical protein
LYSSLPSDKVQEEMWNRLKMTVMAVTSTYGAGQTPPTGDGGFLERERVR